MHEEVENQYGGPAEASAGRDYRAFDRVLDQIREVFLSLNRPYESEERWRWDLPVITFNWVNKYGVHCNLNGLALGQSKPIGVDVESNAWVDEPTRTTQVRHWQHIRAGKIMDIRRLFVSEPTEFAAAAPYPDRGRETRELAHPASPTDEETESDTIVSLISTAYDRASALQKSELREREVLSSRPQG